MLDSILAIIVMVLLYVELCLKSRVGGHLEQEDENELKKIVREYPLADVAGVRCNSPLHNSLFPS